MTVVVSMFSYQTCVAGIYLLKNCFFVVFTLFKPVCGIYLHLGSLKS